MTHSRNWVPIGHNVFQSELGNAGVGETGLKAKNPARSRETSLRSVHVTHICRSRIHMLRDYADRQDGRHCKELRLTSGHTSSYLLNITSSCRSMVISHSRQRFSSTRVSQTLTCDVTRGCWTRARAEWYGNDRRHHGHESRSGPLIDELGLLVMN